MDIALLTKFFAGIPLGSLVIAIVLYIGIAIGGAEVMSRKGRSAVLGFVLLFFLGLLGLVIVLFVPGDSNRLAQRTRPAGGKSSSETSWRSVPHQFANVEDHGELQPCSFCGSRIPRDSAVCRVCRVELGAAHAIPWAPPE